jgi:hypothetical protein
MTTFSARLDETGTDGRSTYAIVAGGVSVPQFWKEVENKYSRLLASRRVSVFHWKEWMDRDGDFKGWSKLKRERFIRAKEKIFEKSIVFTIAVAVHRETHRSVKKVWSGSEGLSPIQIAGYVSVMPGSLSVRSSPSFLNREILEPRRECNLL